MSWPVNCDIVLCFVVLPDRQPSLVGAVSMRYALTLFCYPMIGFYSINSPMISFNTFNYTSVYRFGSVMNLRWLRLMTSRVRSLSIVRKIMMPLPLRRNE